MKHRSSSRDTRRLKRKRNKSSSLKYETSSDERLSPDRIRRRRSPSSPPRYNYEKSRDDYRSPKEGDKSYASYKVLCVSALHAKASDEVIKEALYSEYKKYGDLSIRISHDLEERVAYVCFRNSEDAREAKRSKPRVIIYDKVALVEPVYESSARNSMDRYRDRGRSKQRSRSYSPQYERHRRSPPADIYRTDRFYDRMPYTPLHIPPREYTREIPIHPEFLHRPPLHPAALPPPHLPLGPHLYGLPRPFLPFKPFHPHFFDKFEKRDRFPNYLHHVPPEEDPLATRTLFVGNLELGIGDDEIRRMFNRHGVVEDVDIKRPVPGTGNAYAFVRFKNLDMAHKAKVELSGQYIGKFQCKIGYGKATPTTRIWVGGLGPWTSIAQLEREFDRFGAIKKIDYDKPESCAYILYDSVDAATAAVKEMRGFPLGGSDHKLRVDFADIGSRQKPHQSSYETNDAAISAGDYRQKLSRDTFYDSYDPWHGSDYGYDRRGSHDDERNSARKYEKSSQRNQSPDDLMDKDWKKDYSEIKQNRSSSHNSDDDSKNVKSKNIVSYARTLDEIARKGIPAWQGALVLKSSLFPADFYLVEGNKDIISSLLVDSDTQLLRITQRLRLDQAKLNDVKKRISNAESYAIFLSLAGSSTITVDSSVQLKSLQNLVSYLKQKEAAGVISIGTKDIEVTGVIYVFPPCEFAIKLIKTTAHNLNSDVLNSNHLLLIAVRGELIG